MPLKKTEAEIKFEEAKRQRQKDKITQIASVSHKERVAVQIFLDLSTLFWWHKEFNKYLSSLSEHHDIPKVGPG